MAEEKCQLVYQTGGEIMHIEYNRNGCLLQGSISTLKAINGVVPIIHSTAGCGIQEKYTANTSNHRNDNYTISSTNVFEKQIIFGGTARLREQIKNTVKVLEGDLYVVVSGCATEIVGDDIGAMTKEATEQGYPVIHISTPGFKGNNFHAYKRVVVGIIEELSKTDTSEAEIDSDLVNIFGIAPNFDPYWEGNLEQLDQLIHKVGLKSNHLFGQKSSIENWKQIKRANLNIAFTKYGLEIVQYLQKKYGTPYLYFENLPVGISGIEALLDEFSSVYTDKKDIIDQVKQEEHDRYLYYLSKLAPFYYRNHIQKKVTLVGVSPIVASLGSFLKEWFGQIIQTIIITDEINDKERKQLEKQFENSTNIYYSEDGKIIEELIRVSSPEIILGSQLEENVAKELQIPILYSSLPTENKVILNKSFLGISGILSFLEEYSNALI